jgi:hypothetical protein
VVKYRGEVEKVKRSEVGVRTLKIMKVIILPKYVYFFESVCE